MDNIQSIEVSKISLYAFTGESETQTLKVHGRLSGILLSILIDLGSTHNFVQLSVAKRLHLPISPVNTVCCNYWQRRGIAL